MGVQTKGAQIAEASDQNRKNLSEMYCKSANFLPRSSKIENSFFIDKPVYFSTASTGRTLQSLEGSKLGT